MTKSSAINYYDQRQDVHKERKHDINLFRYEVAEMLLPEDCKGLNVLELGGGIAELTKRMLNKGTVVTFVDLSDKNIEKAKALGVDAHKIDLNEGLVNFKDATIDGVILLEVIEHIVAAEFLLSEINRVLKKNGFVILSTPNFNFFLNRLRILSGKLSIDEGYHYRFFNPFSLRQKMEYAGLRIIKTYNTCPAFGYNFIVNKIFGKPRKHIRIPNFLSSLFAHTLIYKGIKI